MSDMSAPWLADALVSELLQALAVPAWLHRQSQPLQANAALMRLCGIAPEALPSTAHLDLVVPEDRASMQAATDECLHGGGEPPAQSVQLLTSNGTQRPVELTLRRVHLHGQPAALITCMDLSDFQHVQGMLLSMSNLLRQIVGGAPVATYVIDAEHCISHWNAACERLTGCSADDMVGSEAHWRAFYADARPLLADLIVDGRDPTELDSHAIHPVCPSSLVAGAFEQEIHFDASSLECLRGRWISFTVAPLRNSDGAALGAIVTLQDVTQRHRTEEDLTNQLEKLVEARSAELASHARMMDAFIDNAPIGVVYAERQRVVRSNRRMAEIFGVPEAEATETGSAGARGEGFYLSRRDRALLHRFTARELAKGNTVHDERWMHHANGERIWVQINAYVVDHHDAQTGIWWMVQDRTEMRNAQEQLNGRFEELRLTNQKLEQAQNQLLQSDKMSSIGKLAAGVAHEINNPVGFVSSNLHTLRQYVQSLLSLVDAQSRARMAPNDAAAAADLAQTEKAVELDYLKEDLPQLLDESADGLARVKKIVQDLKDFSRVDHSDWQQADLNAGLESTLNVVRNEVKYKAEVVKNLQPLPMVTCLAGQLNQVFMNLIVNASHAIVDRGTITLSSGTQDGWVWLQVDDTGCGMSEETRRRAFEPFYTTKDVGKGTGLGLSLSFSIMQRHGGAIQVRSTLGVGSSFRVWIPIAGPVTDQPGQAQPEPPAWT